MTEEEIDKYSNLIYSITKYFDGYKYKEDLYQEGIIGLLEAKKRYKKEYNVKFSTFAFKYIYGEMSKTVREDKNIKLGRNVIKLKLSIEKARDYLRQRLYREPTKEEIADMLNVDSSIIDEAINMISNTTSMDKVVTSDNKELTYYDVLDNGNMDLNTLVALKEELLKLNEKEREILMQRYNMNYTQEQVAKNLGLTQVNVSREEKKIKQKIKNNLIA